MINKKELKEIKKHANMLKPEFIIGKNGVTSAFVKQVSDYLDAHNIVKIKCLSAENKDAVKVVAADLQGKIEGSVIVDMKGFTFVLYRE